MREAQFPVHGNLYDLHQILQDEKQYKTFAEAT